MTEQFEELMRLEIARMCREIEFLDDGAKMRLRIHEWADRRFGAPEEKRWNQGCAVGCSIFRGVWTHVPQCPKFAAPSAETATPEPKECMHQWATETTTFGKTYCVRCGEVSRDPLAVPVQSDCGCTACTLNRNTPSCTACPCARCLALSAFVTALAKTYAYPTIDYPKNILRELAVRVMEGR